MKRRITWILGACALVSAGCGSDSSEVTETMVTVATFNAGLARGYVDHAELRFDAQLSALNELDSIDVLCLQEVWSPEDRSALIEGLSDVFPHSHFENTTKDAFCRCRTRTCGV